ncbi:MAG: serine hydrolase [Clostridia bacterium]|nr:serine hydrolase [Clostridia bacterium]
MAEKYKLPRARYPEEAGVSGVEIEKFLIDIEENDYNIHSFMVLRHGVVAAECYRAPFTADRPHALYSVSKTFTAVAVGIALGEGLLSLDDKVKDFFPEYTDRLKDKYLDMLTVRHLLTMTSGKNPSILDDKSKGHWVESYFRFPWKSAPGKEFKYVSENTFMLCAILARVTGMCVRDYLQPRLFEPLGIDYPQWETDENGVEAGGWGLYVTTEDIAKLMLLIQNGGEFNGRRIFPEAYAKEMIGYQADNAPANTSPDSRAGYGYCVWRNEGAKGYRADGMFSQFGIVFEDYDAIVAVNSGIPMEQDCRDLIWKYFPAAFIEEEGAPAKPVVPALEEKLRNAAIETPFEASVSPMADLIEGKNIKFRKKIFLNLIGFPMSMLPLAITFMATDRAGNIDDMAFSFEDDALTMRWREGDEENTVKAGMNGRYCYGEMTLGKVTYKVCCTARWLADDRLFVSVRPIETIGKRMLDFRFRADGRVVMDPSSDPSVQKIADYLSRSVVDFTHVKPLQAILRFAISFLPGIVEPKHYGKMR